MKEKITTFINGLIVYDYILFGGVFIIFIALIIISKILRKRIGLAIFLVLLSFSILFLGPSAGYIVMHKYLYKNSIKILSQKQLHFTDAIVLKGELINNSKFDFKSCKITVDVHKSSKNRVKNFLYQFKTLKKVSMLKYDIKKDSSINFKMFIEPFTYKKSYNLSIKANCK